MYLKMFKYKYLPVVLARIIAIWNKEEMMLFILTCLETPSEHK